MKSISLRFLLSAVLITLAAAKLAVESVSRDVGQQSADHPFVTDPVTLNARASNLLEDGPAQDLRGGYPILRSLLVAEAASAEQWSQLGRLFFALRQPANAEYCYLRAAQLAPRSVETLLSIANYYADADRVRAALPYFGKILTYTGLFDSTVFDRYAALKLDFNEIATHGGMPLETRPAQAYFNFLISQGDLANARTMWAWMKPLSPGNRAAEQYVDFLMKRKRTEEAAGVWASQIREREPDYGKTTFVINGSFEREPDGTIFDWRIEPRPHVEARRDETTAHDGYASLRIRFDGKENVNYQGPSQQLFLAPGAYRFEAYVRTSGLTTDEGIGFKITGVDAPDGPVETERISGGTVWKKLERTVSVSGSTRLVQIQVNRRASLRFDSLIEGTAWIDQVSLTRIKQTTLN